MNSALYADIEALARNNDIVHQSLRMARSGQCSYEEALQIAVLKLVAVSDCQQKTLIEYAMRQPAPVMMRNAQ